MSVFELKHSLVEGSCIFLVFLPCIDFILTFLGCIRAGLVAVPVYPPSMTCLIRANQIQRKSKRMFSCSLESSRTVKPKWRYATSTFCFLFPLQRIHEDQACYGHESPLHGVWSSMAGLRMDQSKPHSRSIVSS